jgi:hypothetical protein
MDALSPLVCKFGNADLRNRSATATGEVKRHMRLALGAVVPSCLDALLVHEIVVRKSWYSRPKLLSIVPVPVRDSSKFMIWVISSKRHVPPSLLVGMMGLAGWRIPCSSWLPGKGSGKYLWIG